MAVLNLDTNNTEQVGTTLTTAGSSPALDVDNPNGVALRGYAPDASGVFGESKTWTGMFGYSAQGLGIWGIGQRGGIEGWGNLTGVTGMSGDNGFGAYGYGSVGLYGDSPTGPGVWGRGTGSIWPALEGYSYGHTGVRGVSVSPTPYANIGVLGYSRWGIGVVGVAGSSTSYAGYFIGDLYVTGNKHAAVPHPDGSHRLLYAMESPESWFEDFGRAKLVRGKAKVKLDSSFAAVVRTNDYHVFLSPEGETRGLYVRSRNRAGFEVREQQAGKSNITFSYRVVARRKDVKSPRFKKVKLPHFDRNELLMEPKHRIDQRARQFRKGTSRAQIAKLLKSP